MKRAFQTTKAAHLAFVAAFASEMEAAGAEPGLDCFGRPCLVIETKGGKYRCAASLPILDEQGKRATPFECTVFGRFDEPELARKRTGCNPFNGKWNFHHTAKTAEEGKELATEIVTRILRV